MWECFMVTASNLLFRADLLVGLVETRMHNWETDARLFMKVKYCSCMDDTQPTLLRLSTAGLSYAAFPAVGGRRVASLNRDLVWWLKNRRNYVTLFYSEGTAYIPKYSTLLCGQKPQMVFARKWAIQSGTWPRRRDVANWGHRPCHPFVCCSRWLRKRWERRMSKGLRKKRSLLEQNQSKKKSIF